MAIRKPGVKPNKVSYDQTKNEFNDSSSKNSSHKSNMPTNFELKSIFLEDIDRAVFQEFNKRFLIKDKQMPLMSADAELSAIEMQNYEQFDQDKKFLNGPFFFYTRTITQPKYRTNPTYKQVIYSVPIMKAQGVVYEEYISEGPINHELTYDFTFITDFREYTNQMQQHISDYFKNKRNIIVVYNERFSIGPADYTSMFKVDVVNKEEIGSKTQYVLSFSLKVYCWTRDLRNMQKRERPNSYTLEIVASDSVNEEKVTSTIQIDKYEINNTD